MRHDLRYALRVFRQNPGFTMVAVLSLALGIGANTAIFTLVNTVLLKWLPVEAPEQLVVLARNPARPSPSSNYPDYLYTRDHARSYSGVMAYGGWGSMGVAVEGQATQLAQVHQVSGNYFEVLGVRPHLGRLFNPEDNKTEGAHPYAVLSHGFWQRAFGGDTGVVGRQVRISGSPFTVIGVARAGFTGADITASPDVFIPIVMIRSIDAGVRDWNTRYFWWLTVMGRLKPGVSLAHATAELQVLRDQMEANDPRQRRAKPWDKEREARNRAVILPGSGGFSGMRRVVEKPLLILTVVVGVVLLIACANVANLLLARAVARQREIAIRMAVGAARWRLVRQLLVESVLLAALGTAAGVGFAYLGTHVLLQFLPAGGAPLALNLAPDLRVMLFCSGVTLAAGVLVGLAPAIRATRPDILPWLKTEGRAGAAGRRGLDPRKVLVVAQVALCVLLLAGAALFVRTLANLRGLDLGMRREGVLIVQINPGMNGYKGQRLRSFYERLMRGAQALPGVRSASLANIVPLAGMRWNGDVTAEGYQRRADERPYVDFNAVTPRYFETLGIPILLGRDFLAEDSPAVSTDPPERYLPGGDEQPGGPPRVAIVNETFARRYFAGQSPVGRHFSRGDKYDAAKTFEIVGVVRDTRYFGIREPIEPMVYLPAWRMTADRVQLCVRTAGDTAPLVEALRRNVQQQDAAVPILRTRSMSEFLDQNIVQERLVATLSGFFGLLALLLASVGLYGVTTQSVTRRTREIGIRMAMGAERSGVLTMILREAMLLVGIGALVGIPAALALSRYVESLLFGIKPQDPVTIAAAALLLLLITLAASYLPARRASALDPMEALRYE